MEIVINKSQYNAIRVTSFGIGQSGKRTGIIFNTGMNDFSVPGQKNQFGLLASPGNYIASQKRPQSSMAPTIVANTNGTVRLIIGAAGGTKIPTGIAMVGVQYMAKASSPMFTLVFVQLCCRI